METKTINGHAHIRHQAPQFPDLEMERRAEDFYKFMNQRRSVRTFSNRHVPEALISNLLKTAGTAPSGAHKQPWTFCAISNPQLKSKIRKAAEKEEYDSYHGRMSDRWLQDIAPIGTDWKKPFLEMAPWIIVIFKKIYDLNAGEKVNNYYVNESVGIASGVLITAIHHAGLVTLTHTPSPMNFLMDLLKRPSNERPFLLLPIGYPANDTFVPDLKRDELKEISVFYK